MKRWNMGNVWRKDYFFRVGVAAVLVLSLLVVGCRFRLPPLGKAGKYRTAQRDLREPQGVGVRRAIPLLEKLVTEDPLYRDSLTLLGRGYYQLQRYDDARQILERAVRVNERDEIAWTLLGLTQLRLGRNQQGLESLKGGLSLLYQTATKHGYMGYDTWDRNKLVQSAIRKAIFQVQKDGLEDKNRLIRSGELIIYRIDDEINLQGGDRLVEQRREHN